MAPSTNLRSNNLKFLDIKKGSVFTEPFSITFFTDYSKKKPTLANGLSNIKNLDSYASNGRIET